MDRILSIAPDGAISEIPNSLGKVFLKISGLEAGNPEVEFDVGSFKNILPACMTRLVHTRQLSDVAVSGSWYHNETTLPFYVSVTFHERGTHPDMQSTDSLEILFSLRNSKVLKVTRIVDNAVEKLAVSDCVLTTPVSP